MHRLWIFLSQHRHWFVFIVLQSLAFLLLLSTGVNRRALMWQAEGWLVGHTHEAMTTAYSYIGLREQNKYLLEENARLEFANIALRRQLSDAEAQGARPSLHTEDSLHRELTQIVVARVVNLTKHLGEPYYIISCGAKSGVQSDMAVLSDRGVMGTVLSVSDDYSIVVPIINSKLRLSCSVKGRSYTGTLNAIPGTHSARLGGIPMYATVATGDTILTSGYSYTFPEGLMVGIVAGQDSTKLLGGAGAFANYKMDLATDFDRLSYVYVLLTPPMREAQELEHNTFPNAE